MGTCPFLSLAFGEQILKLLLYDRSGAGTNLKVGGAPIRLKAPEKNFWWWPSTFLALKVQLVVLVSAIVMVSTVW